MLSNRSFYLSSTGFLFLIAGISALARGPKSAPKVLLFLSTDCPIAAGYTPRINALYERYEGKGVTFEAVYPNDLETRPSISAYMSERGYKFPYQLDLGADLAKKLHVNTIPSAVILDGDGREVYRGAIDDNGDPTLARKHYLGDALEAILDGRKPAEGITSTFGCLIMPSKPEPGLKDLNYASAVKNILDKHCVQCHQPGQVAPFSLMGYTNSSKWAPMIARVTSLRQMPPWKAVHGFDEFKGDNSLTETEIATLARWNDLGAPKGNLGAENLTVPEAHEWSLGKPDMILQNDKPFKVAADGTDVYRNFVFQTHFNGPMYVSAVDVQPGNRRVVHHVVLFSDGTHYSDKLASENTDGQDGFVSGPGGPGFLPDGTLGGWVPGAKPGRAPTGLAYLLRKGDSVVVQVHYHKDGKAEEDQTKVALYFSKTPPSKILNITWVIDPRIDIPAGARDHVEKLNFNVGHDMTIYALTPHMHLTGRSMKATVVLPDGTTKPLIYVENWDFHWQLTYALKEPMQVPKGSHIEVVSDYDNSADNLNNPNSPPKDLHWGEQTTDEMMVLVMATTNDDHPGVN